MLSIDNPFRIQLPPQGRRSGLICAAAICVATWASPALAQSVGLPLPRLLTTMPMGGTVGTQIEVTIAGENIDEVDQLYFSTPHLTATPKLDAQGKPEPNKFVVTIAAECPEGQYEARVMTRLGVSSPRAFTVGRLPEAIQKSPNTTLAQAMPLAVNSVCNSVMTTKAIDHYTFEAKKGSRYFVECAAKGVDSKLDAVLVIGDSEGRDLLVDRKGGILDFTAPQDGRFVLKVHELTFKGGHDYFYRLIIREAPVDATLPVPTQSQTVSSFSWPPTDLAAVAATQEADPKNTASIPQAVTLPCDVAGTFFPAADVDAYEFQAAKGETWWIELASERLGFPTDASVLVQRVTGTADNPQTVDVAEFTDIPSPVKVSSNGYAYDGPAFDAGSPDVLGKLEIKEDGLYRILVTDLFGGTRNDSRNAYRLAVRQAKPDFALVAWPLHMELRNGDRNALSKPIALRGGSTMAIEVVALRRDGFDGEIELEMQGLPDGVSAHGIKLASGQSRGIMLITAHQDAPRGLKNATFVGKANIQGAVVTRPCRMAEFKWPIPDSWGEIPEPRLVSDVPVSVSGQEFAPLGLVANENKVWEVRAGDKLTIPMTHIHRSEFSGSNLQMKTFGNVFERTAPFSITLTDKQSEIVIDTAPLNPPPGDYTVAFYGGAVAKYRYRPDAITTAEKAKTSAEMELQTINQDVQKLTDELNAAAPESKPEIQTRLDQAKQKQTTATDMVKNQTEQLRIATERAQPRDTVDIVVSEPVTIRVLAKESK